MEEYKNIDYLESWVGYKDDVKESRNVTLNFNILDVNNPSYFYNEKTYKDDVLDSELTIRIVKENDILYYIENESKTPCEYAKCQELVTKFFYKTEAVGGLYHSGGMYYGDYITEMARDLQDMITIDEEKELLLFDRKIDTESEKLTHTYDVDKLGMLQSFEYHHKHNSDYVDQSILVTKK